ncbi:hypothetical protein MBLNU459_g3650t1 [Dothideomycetes sp. NU459]
MSSADQLAQIYELHRQFYGTPIDDAAARPQSNHQPIIPPLDDDDFAVLATPYAIPVSSNPIAIPARSLPSATEDVSRSYLESCQPLIEQGLESYRRRRQPPSADIFRPVDWKCPKSEPRERDQQREPSLKRAPSAGSSASGSSKLKAHKDNANGGIFRKTSVRYGKLSRALKDYSLGSKSRRQSASSDMMEGVETSCSVTEKENAPQHKGIGRFVGSNKLISSLKTARQDTPQPVNGEMARPLSAASSSSGPRYLAPQFSSDCSAGEAARKAAAASNGIRFSQASCQQSRGGMTKEQYNKRRSICSNPGASDSGAELASNPDIDMLDDVSEDECDFAAVDPVAVLPTEIVTLVFSHLDPQSLKACRGVSKAWAPLSKDSLLWRGQYLQQYQKQNYVSPAPIQIGGIGTGLPNQPIQQWEKMFDARRKIDKNWARGDQGGKGVYLAGHTDSVYCVQFDEQKIITGSRDRTIRVWDINTLKCLKVIGGPSVRPGPGPKVLRTVEYPKFHHAEASVNGTPYGNSIYHVPSDFHSASILCLQYDDEILVTGSSDNDLLIWDIKTWEPIRRLKQHTGGVLDVAFDDKHIISCSKDCSIIVWDRKTLEPIRTLNGHRGPVNAVQLRGNLLVSASGDGVARLWDLNKMDCVREFPPKERGLAAVEFSDDAKYVLAGGNDHITYKFDVATGAEVKTFTGHTQLVRSLFLDTQNRRVVSGSYDLDLRVYDYDTGALLGRFAEWTTSWMLAAKCDYRRIVSTSQDGRILLIDFGLDERGNKIDGVDLLRGF